MFGGLVRRALVAELTVGEPGELQVERRDRHLEASSRAAPAQSPAAWV